MDNRFEHVLTQLLCNKGSCILELHDNPQNKKGMEGKITFTKIPFATGWKRISWDDENVVTFGQMIQEILDCYEFSTLHV